MLPSTKTSPHFNADANEVKTHNLKYFQSNSPSSGNTLDFHSGSTNFFNSSVILMCAFLFFLYFVDKYKLFFSQAEFLLKNFITYVR